MQGITNVENTITIKTRQDRYPGNIMFGVYNYWIGVKESKNARDNIMTLIDLELLGSTVW